MHIIKVCTGGSCRRAFSEETLKKAEATLGISAGENTSDGAFRLEKCGCLSRCEEAPSVFIGKSQSPLDHFLLNGTIATHCTPSKIPDLINSLKKSS